MKKVTVKNLQRIAKSMEKLDGLVKKGMQNILIGAVNNPVALEKKMPEYAEVYREINQIINGYLTIVKEFCIQNNLNIKFSDYVKDVPASEIADELVTTARNDYQELERLLKLAMDKNN
jgi:hypothetical protein